MVKLVQEFETDEDCKFVDQVEKVLHAAEISRYQIVCRPLATDLEIAVGELIHAGWRCIGGVSHHPGMWAQAMVRYGS